MSCKLNNLSKLTSGRAVIDVSDYNIIERMFSTLPPPTVARPEEGSLEYRAQPSLKWANFDWISIRPQPAADGVEEWPSQILLHYWTVSQGSFCSKASPHKCVSACNSLVTTGWHMTWSWHTWQRRHSADYYRVINIDCGSSLLRLSPLTTLTHQGSIHAVNRFSVIHVVLFCQ